jgi:hypothetical protein
MMLMPSSDRLLEISRVPAPTKSSPGGTPVKDVLLPWSTPGVVTASCIGSRPLSGSSATLRVLMISETAASSVLIAVVAASTVTDCEMAPTVNVTSVRTVWSARLSVGPRSKPMAASREASNSAGDSSPTVGAGNLRIAFSSRANRDLSLDCIPLSVR